MDPYIYRSTTTNTIISCYGSCHVRRSKKYAVPISVSWLTTTLSLSAIFWLQHTTMMMILPPTELWLALREKFGDSDWEYWNKASLSCFSLKLAHLSHWSTCRCLLSGRCDWSPINNLSLKMSFSFHLVLRTHVTEHDFYMSRELTA